MELLPKINEIWTRGNLLEKAWEHKKFFFFALEMLIKYKKYEETLTGLWMVCRLFVVYLSLFFSFSFLFVFVVLCRSFFNLGPIFHPL